MRRIKIAQIGINRYSHAPEVFHTLKVHTELFELVGYVLVEDERERCAEKIKKYYDGYPELSLEEVLNDPEIEAVTVETDEIHIFKYAQMAAEAGKHIHMEKPGSQDLRAFEKLIDTVRKTGKAFNVGYMYRYNPFIADAIERAKKGEFGHIFSVEAHMSRHDNKETRGWFDSFEGGMMFYLGCHLVDLVLQLQGLPESVIPLNTATGIDGVASEDFAFAVLKYPNALSFVRAGGTELDGFKRRQLVICGEKMNMEIRPLEALYHDTDEKYMLYCEKDEVTPEGRTHAVSQPYQRYREMMKSFAAIVRGEKENPYTLEYELELFKTILKCCGKGDIQ